MLRIAAGIGTLVLGARFLAARRGHSDLALGNVIGSNILNILLIMGVTAVIHPLPATPLMLAFEIPVMLVISALLLPLALRGRRIDRLEGILLIAGYIVFVLILFQRGGI